MKFIKFTLLIFLVLSSTCFASKYELSLLNFNQELKNARNGNSDSMLNVSAMYADGINVKKDRNKSFYWLNKCAELNESDCMDVLSITYKDGSAPNNEIDLKKSFYWLKRYATLAVTGTIKVRLYKKLPLDFIRLGRMYELGEGTDVDLNSAHYWYSQACRHAVDDFEKYVYCKY